MRSIFGRGNNMVTANRIVDPLLQYFNEEGPLTGGGLQFYLSGTSTPHPTYNDDEMLVANPNPVLCDELGFTEYSIFLDPAVQYKVVILDTDGVTPLKTLDPVFDPASFSPARFQVYNGDPNGNVAGNQGTQGGSNASVIWDPVNGVIWICTTTGDAVTAIWSPYGAQLNGAVVFSGVLSPASFSTDQDDYNPTGLDIAAQLRLNPGANVLITGLAGGESGRSILLTNISNTFTITFSSNNVSSTASNRFSSLFILRPGTSIEIRYDATTGQWRPVGLDLSYNVRMVSSLRINNNAATPNTIVDVTCGSIVVADVNDQPITIRNINISINIGSNGANGLDQGSPVNDTWYAIFVIYNPSTNTIAGLFSTNAVSPLLPSGYTHYMRVGWIRYATAALTRITQVGNKAEYVVVTGSQTPNLPQMIVGAQGNVVTPTYVSVSVVPYVPITAVQISISLRDNSSGGATIVAPSDLYGNLSGTTNPPPLSASATGSFVFALPYTFILLNTNIWYASSSANARLLCLGWVDDIVAS